MRLHRIVLASLILTLSPCGSASGARAYVQSHDDAVAALFYPDNLKVDARGLSTFTEIRDWRTIRADLDATGSQNYLIAAYSNGFSGRVRVIREDAAGPVLVADPRETIMFQSSPSVETSDLDGDSRPEVVVTFVNGRKGRSLAWVFRWNGRTLTNLNPPLSSSNPFEPAERREILDPTFIDLNADGRIEILEPSDNFGVDVEFESEEHSAPVVADQSYTILILGAEGFQQASATATYFGYFQRAAGKPRGETAEFKASSGSYVLRILNGERGKHMVESAVIRLNGRIVASPNDFRAKALVIEKRIALNEMNALTVELRSGPGSRINVIIQRAEN